MTPICRASTLNVMEINYHRRVEMPIFCEFIFNPLFGIAVIEYRPPIKCQFRISGSDRRHGRHFYIKPARAAMPYIGQRIAYTDTGTRAHDAASALKHSNAALTQLWACASHQKVHAENATITMGRPPKNLDKPYQLVYT